MRIHLLFTLLLGAILLSGFMAAPMDGRAATNEAMLQQLSVQFMQQLERQRPQLYYDLLQSIEPAQSALNKDPRIQLMYIDDSGMPVYYTTTNLTAAKTISTDRVWPLGGAGYSLTGSGTSSAQFAIWDAGGALSTHQELTGRITNGDGHAGSHEHSTFVAGTMIASGLQNSAKGMSYQANLSSFDWGGDNSEMSIAAAGGLQVSNHSYGRIVGWYYGYVDPNEWYWFGAASISQTEDYGFGFYGSDAQAWDQIAYNAPDYLIVKSAGNDRNDAGPGPGGGHYYWNGGWTWSTTTREGDGGADGYDCIGWKGTAKNILTVGAVNDIPLGYSEPSDVVQSSFSGWGPTDDGRIKPDVVGNGVSLYSCTNASNTSYGSGSGTSMSAPNVSGSINLLCRHFETEYGATPRSATMKGIVIHTADEAGMYDGPDYQNGWGLMNTEKAADVIASTPPHIIEDNLVTGSDTHAFTLSQSGDLRATICWTDPAGTPPPASLNPAAPMLVHDLDLRLEHVPTATVYYPWRLDKANPANAATTGDNAIDNVEVIDVACAPAGAYIATVSYKGSLGGGQDYTFIWSSEELGASCGVVPSSVNFGSIEMFTYSDEVVTITNLGCDTLRGVVSESSADFSIESGGGAYELLPGAVLNVTVRFQPTTLGTHSTTIETGDAACADVFCTGFALEPPPACAISADTLDFGAVALGDFAFGSFTITNTGYQTLTGDVSEVCPYYLVTTGAGAFSLTHDQVLTVNVVFVPGVPGPDTCIVETGTADCADVVCIGIGDSPPVCSVDPATIDFGPVEVGGFVDTTVTIANTGGGSLSGTVSEPCDHYSITAGGGAYSLGAGQSHVVTLRFEPAAAGPHECTVETGDAACADVFCTGIGEDPPLCSIEPASIDFGAVLVGDSADATVAVTNSGGGLLTGDVTVAAGDVEIVLGAGPFEIEPEETLRVTTRFKPTRNETLDLVLSIGSVRCGDVPLGGWGYYPPFGELTPDTLSFGTVSLGDSVDLSFSITNTGGGILGGDVSESCDHYSIVAGGGPYALANGDTVHVTVRFKPTASGEQPCSIETGSPDCADATCIGTGDDVTGAETSGPLSFELFQNYPNPFKRETKIGFSLDREGAVQLRVYDIGGRLVRTLADRGMTPGVHNEVWDGRDGGGNRVASGIYFLQLKMGQRVVTKKAVLLK